MQSLLEPLGGEFLYIKTGTLSGCPTCLQREGRASPVREYGIKFNNPISPFDSKGLFYPRKNAGEGGKVEGDWLSPAWANLASYISFDILDFPLIKS